MTWIGSCICPLATVFLAMRLWTFKFLVFSFSSLNSGDSNRDPALFQMLPLHLYCSFWLCWRDILFCEGEGNKLLSIPSRSASHSLQERLHHPQAWAMWPALPLFGLYSSLGTEVSSIVCFLDVSALVPCWPVRFHHPSTSLCYAPSSDMSTSIIDAVVLTVQCKTRSWETMAAMQVAIGTLQWAGPLGKADKEPCVLSVHSSVRSVRVLPHIKVD